MKIKSVVLTELPCKHYSTDIDVVVEDDGEDYHFTIQVSGYAPRASRREVASGWKPDWGMDHVESELHLFLAETISEVLSKL